ncbi:MAG: DUF4340 domain-containing protein [Verrucomicrobiota bacterium]
MNKRQVTILWVIAIALGAAVAAVKLSQNASTRSATKRIHGQTLFEFFPATEAATIDIQGAADAVTLARKDGKWVVVQRDNYPANSTFVNDLIRTLGELKVTQGLEAGPSFAPRFGMDEAATKPEDRGLTATFKDASGKELAKVSLGKNIESGAAHSPMGGSSAVGRYVRNHADESGFYAVSEMFPSVSAEAKRWLSDSFISPEKIKSITVSQPGKTEPAWKLTREGEEAEYKLEGATAAEVLDTTATSPLKSLFSYAGFEDVVPADKVAEKIVADQKRTVTLETFEGFTYTVNISPTKPAAAPPAPASPGAVPPAAENFLVTVDVAAELPKERKKAEGEKPEDAKTADTAFSERLKTLSEKLAKEKALAGITFEVGKSTVESLLKDRAGLITKATPPTSDAASNGGVQKLPGGMIARPPVSATTPPIEAVTPPISIPIVEGDQDDEEPVDGVEEEDK